MANSEWRIVNNKDRGQVMQKITNSTTQPPDHLTTQPPNYLSSYLDIPLLSLFKLDWEKAIYLLVLVVAIVTRFWDLGARGMSHDESLHALYSWKLYAGQGYQHNPMMHGPFLFNLNALIFHLIV